MATTIKTTFQLRRGNAEVWAKNNPILAAGEPGFELDTGKLKIGNGNDTYNDLPYIDSRLFTFTITPTNGPGSQMLSATRAEMLAALDAGKTLIGYWTETRTILGTTDTIKHEFRLESVSGTGADRGLAFVNYEQFYKSTLYVNGNDTVSFVNKEQLPNPTTKTEAMTQSVGMDNDGRLWTEPGASGGGGVQSDWNQNDDTASDYVKNRPFYTGDPVETVLVEESTVSFSFVESAGLYLANFPSTFEATVGETYKVSWDGAVYECVCVNFNGMSVFGNLSIIGAGSDTGEPFAMMVGNGQRIGIYTADTSASHTLSISGLAPEVVKIDEKYLPDNLATKQEVEAAQTVADKNKETLLQMLKYVSTFTFDKQTSGRDTFVFNAFNYYKISDFNPSPDDVISFIGTVESGYESSIITTGNNCVQYGSFIVVASAGRCSLPVTETATFSFTAPSAGLYAMYNEGNTSQTAGTGQFTLMQIDGLTIKSSTANSTKKFRITVDDSGTLTATEITTA